MYRPALIALALLAACAQGDPGAPLPDVTASVAPNIASTPEGHARDACRNAAQVQRLTVLSISDVRPIGSSGTDMVLRVSQGGAVSDLRCSCADATRLTELSPV